MNVLVAVLIVWIHFVADFLFQSHNMSTKKSKSWQWFFRHIGAYSLPFLIIGPLYAGLVFCSHTVVDAISCQITSRLWKKEKWHWFFVTIGADQAIHLSSLLLVYHYMPALRW